MNLTDNQKFACDKIFHTDDSNRNGVLEKRKDELMELFLNCFDRTAPQIYFYDADFSRAVCRRFNVERY